MAFCHEPWCVYVHARARELGAGRGDGNDEGVGWEHEREETDGGGGGSGTQETAKLKQDIASQSRTWDEGGRCGGKGGRKQTGGRDDKEGEEEKEGRVDRRTCTQVKKNEKKLQKKKKDLPCQFRAMKT